MYIQEVRIVLRLCALHYGARQLPDAESREEHDAI